MTADLTQLGFTPEQRELDDLVPYWRNPRIISDEAVNAVARSIEKYGYQQPIIVDDENVIIIGHTRYMALRRLGYTEATVGVARDLSPREVKQLRTVDNRTSEYAEWDLDKLADELSKLTDDLTESYFSELAEADQLPETGDVTESTPTATTPTDQTGTATAQPADSGDKDKVEFICPGCFHSWEMRVTEKQLRAGLLREGE